MKWQTLSSKILFDIKLYIFLEWDVGGSFAKAEKVSNKFLAKQINPKLLRLLASLNTNCNILLDSYCDCQTTIKAFVQDFILCFAFSYVDIIFKS